MAVAFLSGFYVFSLENILIRMTGLVLGSTTYAFSIIVASFILAIALGSYVAGALRGVRKILALNLWALVTASLLLYVSVPFWPIIFLRVRLIFMTGAINFPLYWVTVLTVFVLILIVPVALMGMTLPLLFSELRSRLNNIAALVGRLYAANAVGCVIGVSVGGYALFAILPDYAVFKTSLLIMIAAAVIVSFLFLGTRRSRLVTMALAVAATVVTIIIPAWNSQHFVPSFARNVSMEWPAGPEFSLEKIREEQSRLKLVFTRHDPNTIVGVVEGDVNGQLYRVIMVNGKSDGSTLMDRRTTFTLALLPISLAKQARDIFVIGLGTGLTASAATHFSEVSQVDIAEISSGVIESMPLFDPLNLQLLSRRHKFQFHNADALRVLKGIENNYDVILSEPSNLWLSGVENLYSKKFLSVARSKLREGGLYAQWFHIYEANEPMLLTILKTFQDVFPNQRLNILFKISYPSLFPDLFGDKRFTQYRQLLEMDRTPKILSVQNYRELREWLGPYDELSLFQLRPKLEPLAALLPDRCQEDECFALKRELSARQITIQGGVASAQLAAATREESRRLAETTFAAFFSPASLSGSRSGATLAPKYQNGLSQ